MATVSRADKKCVREMIFSLESSSNLDIEKINNFKKYLFALGFPNNSEYVNRINNLERKIGEKGLEEKREKILPTLPKTVRYSGAYFDLNNRTIPVRVDYRYDHLFLSRNYKQMGNDSNGMKVSWRFESNGELYLIDCLNVSSREPTHVLGPMNNRKGPHSWTFDLDPLFSNFSWMDSNQKTDLLLKWGYSSASDLFRASSTNNLRDSKEMYSGEVGLKNIVLNSLVLKILQNTSLLTPRLHFENGLAFTSYKEK